MRFLPRVIKEMSLTTSFRAFIVAYIAVDQEREQQMCFPVTKGLFAPLTLFTDAEGDSQSRHSPPEQHQKLVTSVRRAETTD